MGIENPMVQPLGIGESDAFGRIVVECHGCGRTIHEDEHREYFYLEGTEFPYCDNCVDDCDILGEEE